MAREYRFNFKRLDVYQAAVSYFLWVVEVTAGLSWRYREVSDQVVSSALSIVGNVGEAGGRRERPAESSQHYRYALGSTHEAAAYLDALASLGSIDDATYNEKEQELARIGSMLTRLITLQNRRRTSRPPRR